MKTEIKIDRIYDEGWAREICALWNRAFGPAFELNERLWLYNTVSDPDFSHNDVWLAHDAERLVGLAVTRRFSEATLAAWPSLERYRLDGYLAALAVDPAHQRQGLGRRLVAAAQTGLTQAGATRLVAGGNFRHFFPGVPTNLLAAQAFFRAEGFQPANLEYDLDGALDPHLYEPTLAATAPDLSYRQGLAGEGDAWLSWLAGVFPGRWHYSADLYLKQGGKIEDVTFLTDGSNNIQGFLMTHRNSARMPIPVSFWLGEDSQWGAIGPLGVSPTVRGKGAGLGLVAAGMRYLHSQGVRQARIDWTTLLDFYGKLGFQPSQTYERATKSLT